MLFGHSYRCLARSNILVLKIIKLPDSFQIVILLIILRHLTKKNEIKYKTYEMTRLKNSV